MAALEWSKAHALRETEWRSASLSLALCNVTTVRRTSSDPNDPGSRKWQMEEVGLSLSEGHYDVLSARRYAHGGSPQGNASGSSSGGGAKNTAGERERFSAENAVWVRTRVLTLRHPVRFIVPPRRFRNTHNWTIASAWPSEEEEVNLVFSPVGVREASFTGALGLVESDFLQPYGTFEGFIRVTGDDRHTRILRVEGGFGVVEDHRAVW